MKNSILWKVVLILLTFLFSQYSTSDASSPFRPTYDEGKWDVDMAPYSGFIRYPDSGLSAFSSFGGNEPFFSYPGHSGYIRGISDTVAISVSIQNHDTTDFSIVSYQPQNWFMPVIYNEMLNPTKFDPYADSTLVHYKFIAWTNDYCTISTPSILPKNRNKRLALLYYVWNLPVGKSRLLMVKTSTAPSEVQYLYNYTELVKVSDARSLADTLNAYAACSERALTKTDYISSSAWCDTMLLYNNLCIPAYAQKALINNFFRNNDSLVEKTALDSAYALLLRYGDPVLGDTSTWGGQTWEWYRHISAWVSVQRYRSNNGVRWARGG